MKSEKRWVIVGRYGLYEGQWIRRIDAVYSHVHDLFEIPHSGPNSPLSEQERTLWEKCQRKGDRVVRATITYEESPWLTSASPSSESEPIP